jgi:hypothetical protein
MVLRVPDGPPDLKGPGMRWDKDGAEAIIALAGLYNSSLWANSWDLRRAA